MRRFVPSFSTVLALLAATSFALLTEPAHAEEATATQTETRAPNKRRPNTMLKHKRRQPLPQYKPAEPNMVPPGAQLTPDRVIEAPQAPSSTPPPSTTKVASPKATQDRVTVPARAVTTEKRDYNQEGVRPPYPTGVDPGRNMQAPPGWLPSSKSFVP